MRNFALRETCWAATTLCLMLAATPGVSAPEPNRLDETTRAAQQLAWEQRFDEALAVLADVLAEDPLHSFAQRERAKILSWARRYEESAAAFRALLEQDPADLEARVGLARVLSWSGDQPAARREYQTALEQSPEHTDAMLGLAQTLAWSGAFEQARKAYAAYLAVPGERLAGQIGLAYIDLWEGSAARARRQAEALASAYPDNDEITTLLYQARRATAPWILASWDQIDDNDRNLLTTARMEAGGTLPFGPTVRFSYNHYDVRTAGRNGTLNSLQGTVGMSPRRGHLVEAMLGVDRMESDAVSGHSVTDWGVRWDVTLPSTWRGTLRARREPFRYSVPLIDNRIVQESVVLSANGPLGGAWWLSAELSAWRLSDDNSRLATEIGLRRRHLWGQHTLNTGLNLRWLDWDKDLDNGYFDPSNFRAWGLVGRAFGPIARCHKLNYDVSLELGLQSFDRSGISTVNDPYYLVTGLVGWQATQALRWEAYADGGSYASQGGAQWRYVRAGLRLRYQFGERAR